MKIIVAMDSFKGCASSQELSCWVKEGIEAVDPLAEVVTCCIADGGEGMLEAIMQNSRGTRVKCRVHDPLMHLIEAEYGILDDGLSAVIEMAQAAGLPLVPLEKRNPLYTTTYGVGELMKDAIGRGCRKFIVGIGGSATHDAGLGMMQALGYRFFDKEGRELAQGGVILEAFHAIDDTHVIPELKACEFTVACDVDNLMYGANGSALIYAAQKGADTPMIERLDKGMEHFVQRLHALLDVDLTRLKGSGAAGGMGGGLHAFLGAKLQSGIDILLDVVSFERLLDKADWVITGEGRIDNQSFMGKVLSGVVKRAQQAHIPVIALGGGLCNDIKEHHNVDAMFSIMRYPISLEEAIQKEVTQQLVRTSVYEIFRLIKAAQRK